MIFRHNNKFFGFLFCARYVICYNFILNFINILKGVKVSQSHLELIEKAKKLMEKAKKIEEQKILKIGKEVFKLFEQNKLNDEFLINKIKEIMK